MTRRARVLLVVVVFTGAGAAGGWLALRSGAGATGLCASAPTGLKGRYVPKSGLQEATLVLTNFRFGQMDDFYGLAPGRRWPRNGITIAVSNEGPDSTPRFRRALHVTRADFEGFEGMRLPAANLGTRSKDRVLDAYVEVRTVTAATIATVNRALAAVRVCSV